MAASDITSRFGASVRRLRHRLGISQDALAERADLHRTYITGIECGVRNVTLKSIDKLARALQVSTAALLQQASKPPGGAGEATEELTGGKRVDILMVEDDEHDVELAVQALQQAKITNPIHVVHDGAEALDYLFCTGRFAHRKMQNRPQLVLLDLFLPKLNGMEVLRRIKADERTRTIPVVVLTTVRDSRELIESRQLGVETYIVKPVNFQGLRRVALQLNFNWALLEPMETITRNVQA